MTRALVTQLADALESGLAYVENEADQLTTREYKTAITAAREYLATEPSGERAELIARLRMRQKLVAQLGLSDGEVGIFQEASDMLEADAQEIEALECDYTDQVLRAIAAEEALAQQAKRVPMTNAEAHQILLDMANNIEKFGDGTESNEQLSSECIRFILERVDNHKIPPAQKPTDWVAA